MPPTESLAEARKLFMSALADIQKKDYLQAEKSLRQALRLMPERPSLLVNYAGVLTALEHDAEAAEIARKATHLQADSVDAWLNLGLAQEGENRMADATQALQQAIRLNPGCAAAYAAQGRIQRQLGNPEEAIRLLQQAARLQPDEASTYNNLGNAFKDLNETQAALDAYHKALELNPDDAETTLNLGLVELLTGHFDTGWRHYEARFRAFGTDRSAYFSSEHWSGEQNVSGRRVLVYSEQGFGDTLQFCRYVHCLKEAGAIVILAVQPPLLPLLQTLMDVDELCGYESGKENQLPTHDYHCPLLSLPRVLGPFPCTNSPWVPYLEVPESYREKWRNKLPGNRLRRIGVAWSGFPGQKNDRNRSMALGCLAPLFEVDADFYVLQTDIRTTDRSVIEEFSNLHDMSPYLRDFADTAAVVEQLDLVVSVCTSIAHLAGAMGAPLYVLLCHAADWRWQLECSDSPWYPTARLFRQPSPGDWNTPVTHLVREVVALPPQP